MLFSEIGFRGQYVQIAPTYRLIPESNVLMLASSYGNPLLSEKIFDECEREYLAANQDFDVTSPFPKLTCLDGVANRIYTTMLFLNDHIYSNYNKNKFSEGFEFILLQKMNNKIYWAQIGWPHMFLISNNKLIGIDHSIGQRSFKPSLSPNMPHSLLGLENSLNFRVESTCLKSNEELLFIKGDNLPAAFYHSSKLDNESLIRNIFTHSSKTGAWLGRLKFSGEALAVNNKVQNL